MDDIITSAAMICQNLEKCFNWFQSNYDAHNQNKKFKDENLLIYLVEITSYLGEKLRTVPMLELSNLLPCSLLDSL